MRGNAPASCLAPVCGVFKEICLERTSWDLDYSALWEILRILTWLPQIELWDLSSWLPQIGWNMRSKLDCPRLVALGISFAQRRLQTLPFLGWLNCESNSLVLNSFFRRQAPWYDHSLRWLTFTPWSSQIFLFDIIMFLTDSHHGNLLVVRKMFANRECLFWKW